MAENQNDKRNQQSDSKSKQESTQDGNKKEINPNTPVANAGTKQSNHEQHDSSFKRSSANTDVLEADEKEEETADVTHGAKKTGDADAAKNDSKTSNQNHSKGNL